MIQNFIPLKNPFSADALAESPYKIKTPYRGKHFTITGRGKNMILRVNAPSKKEGIQALIQGLSAFHTSIDIQKYYGEGAILIVRNLGSITSDDTKTEKVKIRIYILDKTGIYKGGDDLYSHRNIEINNIGGRWKATVNLHYTITY